MKIFNLFVIIAISLSLPACGGDNSDQQSNHVSANSISSISISIDEKYVLLNDFFNLNWSISGSGTCSFTGLINESVTSSGSKIIQADRVGELNISLQCNNLQSSASIQVLPRAIEVPDPIFADALTRLGYPVVSGLMDIKDALAIEKLCINGNRSFYGLPDDDNIIWSETNFSVPDWPVTCAFTNKDEYIKDISGLEYFFNLKTLRVTHQKIVEFDLSNLSKLFYFTIWGNPVENLDLSKNTAIEIFNVSETSLTTVDTSGLVNLRHAEFQQNYDREMPPYTLSHGTFVKGFSHLDFSNNPKLELLYLTSNPLKELGISKKNSLLRELWASRTLIKSLDLRGFTKLNYVILNQSFHLENLNAYGINNFMVPFRFYCQECPNLYQVFVHDVAGYLEWLNKSRIWLDQHITLIEGAG